MAYIHLGLLDLEDLEGETLLWSTLLTVGRQPEFEFQLHNI